MLTVMKICKILKKEPGRALQRPWLVAYIYEKQRKTMGKIFWAAGRILVVVALAAFGGGVMAQTTKPQVKTIIGTTLPSNSSKEITAAKLRQVLNRMVDYTSGGDSVLRDTLTHYVSKAGADTITGFKTFKTDLAVHGEIAVSEPEPFSQISVIRGYGFDFYNSQYPYINVLSPNSGFFIQTYDWQNDPYQAFSIYGKRVQVSPHLNVGPVIDSTNTLAVKGNTVLDGDLLVEGFDTFIRGTLGVGRTAVPGEIEFYRADGGKGGRISLNFSNNDFRVYNISGGAGATANLRFGVDGNQPFSDIIFETSNQTTQFARIKANTGNSIFGPTNIDTGERLQVQGALKVSTFIRSPTIDSLKNNLTTSLDLKANLDSPTFTGTVSGITKSMVGLGSVDNTSDLSKPISTATQAALDGKANASALSGYVDIASAQTVTGTKTLTNTLTVNNNLNLDANTDKGFFLYRGGVLVGNFAHNSGGSFSEHRNIASLINNQFRGYGDNVLNGSVGSLLVGTFTNSGEKLQVNGSSRFQGLSTFNAGTKYSSTSSGIELYNTSDEVTNWEKVKQYWNGNAFKIENQWAGTGVGRNIEINANSANFRLGVVSGNVPNISSAFSFTRAGSHGNLVHMGGSHANNANTLSLTPAIVQSGTHWYKLIYGSVYEQSVGSGEKLLIDLGTNSAADGAGTHTSRFKVDNAGVVTASGDAYFNGVRVGLGAGNNINNVVIGTSTGSALTTSAGIVHIGAGAGSAITSGGFSTFIGTFAGTLTTGGANTGVGYAAGRDNTTGTNNVFLGVNAGRYIADGIASNSSTNSSIFIGSNVKALANSQTNQIVIGDYAVGLGSNTTVLGNSSTTFTRLFGKVGINTSVNAGFDLDVAGSVRGTTVTATAATGGSAILSGAGTGTGVLTGSGALLIGAASINMIRVEGGGIKITPNVSTVDQASALLDISSTTKGFLPPRMTTAQFNAIPSKAPGLEAFSTDDAGKLFYDGTRVTGFRFNGTKFQGYDGTNWIDLN